MNSFSFVHGGPLYEPPPRWDRRPLQTRNRNEPDHEINERHTYELYINISMIGIRLDDVVGLGAGAGAGPSPWRHLHLISLS